MSAGFRSVLPAADEIAVTVDGAPLTLRPGPSPLAALLPAEQPGSAFAVVIMEQDEYVPMCGHCIIGTATTVVATGMVTVEEPVTRVRFDTPAGLVVCDVAVADGSVEHVSFDNVDSFLL